MSALVRSALPTTMVALLLVGGCTTKAPGSIGGAIAVTVTDSTCDVARTTASPGTVEFAVTNEGTTTTEFYVYAAGGRMVGEAENIGPGLSRSLHVELTEPGTYETACKPDSASGGIRAPFTVTGTSATAAPGDPLLTDAATRYERYVSTEADLLLARTRQFTGLVKAGRVEQAKALYPQARAPWERIEPVAESFGDLDPRIDGREDVLAEGMPFTGFHRLEKDLWVDGLQPNSSAVADQLLADVTTLVTQAKAVELTALQLANGSKALLDEIATGKVTGEEERYSHTDLWDFDANLAGSRAALTALEPFLTSKDPALVAELNGRGDALEALLKTHREGSGFVPYTALTSTEVKALTQALDAFAEPVSRVAGLVAKG